MLLCFACLQWRMQPGSGTTAARATPPILFILLLAAAALSRHPASAAAASPSAPTVPGSSATGGVVSADLIALRIRVEQLEARAQLQQAPGGAIDEQRLAAVVREAVIKELSQMESQSEPRSEPRSPPPPPPPPPPPWKTEEEMEMANSLPTRPCTCEASIKVVKTDMQIANSDYQALKLRADRTESRVADLFAGFHAKETNAALFEEAIEGGTGRRRAQAATCVGEVLVARVGEINEVCCIGGSGSSGSPGGGTSDECAGDDAGGELVAAIGMGCTEAISGIEAMPGFSGDVCNFDLTAWLHEDVQVHHVCCETCPRPSGEGGNRRFLQVEGAGTDCARLPSQCTPSCAPVFIAFREECQETMEEAGFDMQEVERLHESCLEQVSVDEGSCGEQIGRRILQRVESSQDTVAQSGATTAMIIPLTIVTNAQTGMLEVLGQTGRRSLQQHVEAMQEFRCECGSGVDISRCIPVCDESIHGFELLMTVDQSDVRVSCKLHAGLFSWAGAVSEGSYFGDDTELFISTLVSGAAGRYILMLRVSPGVQTTLNVQRNQEVRISGDRALLAQPQWGSGGFIVRSGGSLALSYLHVSILGGDDGSTSLVLQNGGSLSLESMAVPVSVLTAAIRDLGGVGNSLKLTDVTLVEFHDSTAQTFKITVTEPRRGTNTRSTEGSLSFGEPVFSVVSGRTCADSNCTTDDGTPPCQISQGGKCVGRPHGYGALENCVIAVSGGAGTLDACSVSRSTTLISAICHCMKTTFCCQAS